MICSFQNFLQIDNLLNEPTVWCVAGKPGWLNQTQSAWNTDCLIRKLYMRLTLSDSCMTGSFWSDLVSCHKFDGKLQIVLEAVLYEHVNSQTKTSPYVITPPLTDISTHWFIWFKTWNFSKIFRSYWIIEANG